MVLWQILYAAQRHTHVLPDGSRAGFFIGDGAGVGKVCFDFLAGAVFPCYRLVIITMFAVAVYWVNLYGEDFGTHIAGVTFEVFQPRYPLYHFSESSCTRGVTSVKI